MVASNGLAESFQVKKKEPAIVYPAGKTPNGLYFLSNLDQTYPYPIEVLFAYQENGKENGNAIEVIKESLAKVLVEFYPYSGCLTKTWDGKMMVRLTGEGVQFVEAFSDNKMKVLGDISVADPGRLRKLVHYAEGNQSIIDVPLLTIQVTSFKCGGIVLGVRFNHVLIDGRSFSDLMICWSEIARGVPLSIHPYFDCSLLKARQPPTIDILHDEYLRKEKSTKIIPFRHQEHNVYKSFCFEPAKIVEMKKMANNGIYATCGTTFEVLAALVWILRTKSFKISSEKTTKILTAVDGRPKFKSTLPKGYFGNGIAWSCAQCNAGELTQKPFSFAVKIVQNSIKDVTEDYIKSAIDHFEVTRAGLETENTFCISKWSRLPFYDADFGWGQPSQVVPASLVDDLVLTLSQENGSENIILAVGLPASIMETFEELMQLELMKLNIV